MKRLLNLLVLPVTIVACAQSHVRSTESPLATGCPRMPTSDAVVTDSVPLNRLAGRARLVRVDTVNPQRTPWFQEINLQPPDSAFRRMLADVNSSVVRVPPTGRPVPPLVHVRSGWPIWMAGPFAMSSGECLGILCADASPTYYEFRNISPTVVRGIWWNNMTGIGVLIDPKSGRRLPHPAGYFCMTTQ